MFHKLVNVFIVHLCPRHLPWETIDGASEAETLLDGHSKP